MAGIRRRSLFAAGAAALGAPALLTGCGKSGNAKELTFWNFYAPNPNPGDPTLAAQSKWFEDMVAGWNRENETKIRLQYVTILGTPKLATAFAADEGPDIFLISPGDILRYYNAGVLTDLTPYLTKEAIDDFSRPNMDTRLVGDRVYALPMEIEPLAMFYSKRVMESVGVTGDSDLPTTWDEMLGLGEKLKREKKPPIVFCAAPGYYQNFTWYPWMWQGGGNAVSADGRHSGFDSKGAVDALNLYKQTIQRGIAPRVEPANADGALALMQGYAAAYHTGIWSVAEFRHRKPDFPYGVFAPPTPPGGTPKTVLGGWAFVANARGRDPETAAKFCTWAIGSMSQDSIDRVVDWCTKAKADIAPRKSALDKGTRDGGYDNEIMRKFKDEIFPTGRGEPRYPPVVYKAISDAIQACQLTGADPRQQAELASKQIDAYLKSYEGGRIL
ncbi:MAG TPA: sugar ABC transporter substrate-binding protein [Actinocatenispora sp.]